MRQINEGELIQMGRHTSTREAVNSTESGILWTEPHGMVIISAVQIDAEILHWVRVSVGDLDLGLHTPKISHLTATLSLLA